MKASAHPVPVVASLLAATFILATHVAPSPGSVYAGGTSLIDRLIGVSRSAMSQKFFEDADLYFHRGVGAAQPRALTNLYEELALKITPRQHAHGDAKDVVEIIPWLRFATKIDPHNIDAFLTAAYWLGRADEHEAVDEVFREALRNNPDDFQLYESKGQYEFRRGQYDRAARSFDASLRLWRPDPDDEHTYFHAAHVMSYRGIVHELFEEYDEAVALYKDIVDMMPPEIDCSMFLSRIEALQKGDGTAAWSMQRINEVFGRNHASHMMDFSAADDTHEEHEGHDHHDHSSCGHDCSNH